MTHIILRSAILVLVQNHAIGNKTKNKKQETIES